MTRIRPLRSFLLGFLIALALAGAVYTGARWFDGGLGLAASEETAMPEFPPIPENETPEQALKRIQEQKLIVNAHEHAENMNDVPRLLEASDAHGLLKTVLLGSSHFTITLNPQVGFTRYDEYNENMLQIALAHPDRFEAWPTISPVDPEMLEKFSKLVERGARGLKLYTGHGYVIPRERKYMFHPVAMDDPRMFPLYEYCEVNYVPIIWHVNPSSKAPGFAQEFIEILTRYPDLKVICPHFMLSSIMDSRLREFLDTFPNLYSDLSFGHDDFLIAGLKRISRDPEKFRRIFREYPDRFFFGTDLVITNHPSKTAEWTGVRIKAYLDMLTQATYTAPFIPNTTLNGLELTSPLLDDILYRNFHRFMALKPKGTKITREINWGKMNVDRLERAPGQAFPPPAD
ncbi:MAG TPA: amidohydrolase family protein [Candidatus Hydrogenedentes bacterium]|nr:amidohydrolase family protein [Candidatus Hydrogenedentota bacterium]